MKDINIHGLSLRARLKFLLKDSFLYGGASALTRAISLVTFPLLTRYFSVEDYGQIDFFMVFANFLAISIVFGQDSSVARFFYEYEELEDRRELISQSLIFQVLLLFFILPVLWIWADQLAPHLSSSSKATSLLKLNILQIPFLVLNNFSINLLKWTFSRSKFLFISLGSIFSYMVLLVLGIKCFKMDIYGVFVCVLMSQSVFSLIGFYFIRNWIILPRRWKFLRELLIYALPYGIICCLSAFVPTMERLFVGSLIGVRELGLYAAGSKMAMLMGVVIQAFQTAWGPFSLSIHKASDSIHTFNMALKVFVLLVGIMVIALTFLADPMIGLFASAEYQGASVVVFPLALGLAFQSTGWITDIGIGISKKSYLKLVSYVLFIFVTGSSIYLFAKPYGLPGIACGVMFGHLSNAVISTYFAQRVYPLNWSFSILLFPAVYVVGMGMMFPSVSFNEELWHRCVMLFFAVTVFLGGSYLFMLSSKERDLVVSLIKKSI